MYHIYENIYRVPGIAGRVPGTAIRVWVGSRSGPGTLSSGPDRARVQKKSAGSGPGTLSSGPDRARVQKESAGSGPGAKICTRAGL